MKDNRNHIPVIFSTPMVAENEKNDLIEAADRALYLLTEMSDDELILTLEQCDASLAYAVNYHTS